MTSMATVLLPPETHARERLADPACRAAVAALVRRRVPANDVEDVAQTVLCDALAAPRTPATPSELRRFLCVLTRNKVADFHRRARGSSAAPVPEVGAPPPPVEARALLRRVVDSLATPRDRETLEWMVREHDGEELREIAADAGLPAATVRQRVSRLRRSLRAQWAHALALCLAIGAGGAAAAKLHGAVSTEVITRDPAGDPGARLFGIAQGRWRIVDRTSFDRANGPALDAHLVEVRVTGAKVEVVSPLGTHARIITASATKDGRAFAVTLEGGATAEHATIVVDGERLVVTASDGPLRGPVTLARK